MNEFGRRLDYSVEDGLYQGKSNAIGNDGLWADSDHRVIVVEVKTTDTYRINLDTLAGYREQLISSSKIGKDSSLLLVVGRQDTGDLEAQVRGSRHAWTIRIISVDALAKLISLKENAEMASVKQIHELLTPFEYTRLDKIIEIAFTVAEDASSAAESDQVPDVEPTVTPDGQTRGKTQHHTSAELINSLRAQVVSTLSSLFVPLVKKSRALYWSADKSFRVAVTLSKEYEGGEYWYAYHPDWDNFLSEGENAFYVLGASEGKRLTLSHSSGFTTGLINSM